MLMPRQAQIDAEFRQKYAKSATLYERSRRVFPSGVTHDGRYLEPFPIFVTQASGSRKTSAEGHSIIDYWVGHGALLLGHGFPAVVKAVQEQMALGTHYSACHELEIAWGERVQKMIPSAEQVRFTSSGTEATLMAVRVARIVTGRQKVVKFIGHFHGWHDSLVLAAYAPYNTADWSMPGITSGVQDDVVVIAPNDLELVEQTFRETKPACCIIEGTGGHWGLVPVQGEFLKGLRELCTKYGVLLIFDEVISGFRVHPGGSQAHYGVTPDMTTLAKILAGGLPGGALAGRADLLEAIAFGNRYGKKMKHPGTYNGNPLSAAAGCAALDAIANGTPCQRANDLARDLRSKLNQLFASRNAPCVAYGEFSMIHILPNYDGPRPTSDSFIPYEGDYRKLDADQPASLKHALRSALLIGGVDWFGWSGMTSAAHTADDLDQTVRAFDQAVTLLGVN